MTTNEMIFLSEHADSVVRKLGDHYGELFDACSDFGHTVEAEGLDSEQAADDWDRVVRVMKKQPNVEKPPALAPAMKGV
jgi:hypothetical protein